MNPNKKIYYNIEETSYKFLTKDFVFYFSSMFYMEKFKMECMANRINMSYKLSSRYNIQIHANSYFDVILYSNIEKRGFKIVDEKTQEVITCLQDIILDGEIKTLKNYNELHVTLMQR